MARYSAQLYRTLSTTASLGSTYTSATLRRHRWIDIMVGVDGTPGDTACNFQIARTTTTGTSTSVTPNPIDPVDAACVALAGRNFSAEPTYGVVLLNMVFNQRSTVRWFAAPGEELVSVATQNYGIGISTPTAPALSGYATVVFDE